MVKRGLPLLQASHLFSKQERGRGKDGNSYNCSFYLFIFNKKCKISPRHLSTYTWYLVTWLLLVARKVGRVSMWFSSLIRVSKGERNWVAKQLCLLECYCSHFYRPDFCLLCLRSLRVKVEESRLKFLSSHTHTHPPTPCCLLTVFFLISG